MSDVGKAISTAFYHCAGMRLDSESFWDCVARESRLAPLVVDPVEPCPECFGEGTHDSLCTRGPKLGEWE